MTTITRSLGPNNGPRVVLGYDDASRLVSLSRTIGGAGTAVNTTLAYDALDRLTTLTHQTGGGTSLASYSYAFDAIGRLTRETNAEGTVTYSYDNIHQLVGADRPVGQTDEAYSYDNLGNRTMAGYTTGAGNRLLASPGFTYTYDFEGNLASKTETATGKVTTYAYDHRNRLTGVTQRASSGGAVIAQATFTYDALNRRIRTQTDADGAGPTAPVRRWTVYDGENPYADFANNGTLQTRYLHGSAVDFLLARTSSTGTTAWYLTDRLGSVRDIANTSGTVIDHIAYDSYGNVISESSPTNGDRFKFTGREYDPVTGLQYNRARYYDAVIGRWTQEDPIGFAAGDANLYRYVGNGPTNWRDAYGLDKIRPYPQPAHGHKDGEGVYALEYIDEPWLWDPGFSLLDAGNSSRPPVFLGYLDTKTGLVQRGDHYVKRSTLRQALEANRLNHDNLNQFFSDPKNAVNAAEERNTAMALSVRGTELDRTGHENFYSDCPDAQDSIKWLAEQGVEWNAGGPLNANPSRAAMGLPGVGLRMRGGMLGRSQSHVLRHAPKNWRRVQAEGNGWKLLDENGIERVRFMRPDPKGRFVHQQTGYWRFQDAYGNYLDECGNVVPKSDPRFNLKTHIPYSGVD